MIITCRKQVPLSWITLAVLPWAAVVYKSQVMGAAFIFSLKKFVDNPAGLTFVLSLPGFISLIVAPLSSFLSDRIWTRFGRRKPFILTSWCGTVGCMTLMPLAPNFWWLLACYLCFGLFNDIGSSPTEVMNQEIVPPHQRGRATAGMQWSSNFATLIFYFVALGRFDDVQFVGGFPISGEKVIYWSSGLLLGVMAIFVMLGVRETRSVHSAAGERLSPRSAFTAIFDRTLWPVYALIFASAMLNSGLGAMGNLLYIEQWHYSKQEMGINVAVGTSLNLVLIVFLGIVADRFNRMRAYQTLIIAALTIKAAYFCYVKFVLPDQRPTLVEIIVFGEMLSICSILTSVVFTPLVYDYVTRDKMGTYAAGATMVTRLTQLVTLNGVGLFVWGYAALFQPPAGEMVRIVLKDPATSDEIRGIVRDAGWNHSAEVPVVSETITARAWYGTGLVTDRGRCWEIRSADAGAEKLVARKETISKGIPTEAGDASNQIAVIDQELYVRAEQFKQQVVRAFRGRLLAEGEQIVRATLRPAVLVELRTDNRLESDTLHQIRNRLRAATTSVIDLRAFRRGDSYRLTVSAFAEEGQDIDSAARDIDGRLRPLLQQSGITVAAGNGIDSIRSVKAAELTVMLVEDPLARHRSPIMRAADFLISGLITPAGPEDNLTALASLLRSADENRHLYASADAAAEHQIQISAILPPSTESFPQSQNDGVDARLKELLPNQTDVSVLSSIRALYDAVIDAASAQRLTVTRPVIAAGFAPLQYDYMCGYLWMFCLGLVGLVISFAFARRERQGLMRNWGVEEAERQ